MERHHHAPARSTAHLAELRGATEADGVKCLLMKAHRTFTLVALRADHALDNRALRHALGVNRLRFATRPELLDLTGLVPGQVPPIGEPLLPLPLVADVSVWSRPTLSFTCGTHTDSLTLDLATWEDLAQPRKLSFARPPGADG